MRLHFDLIDLRLFVNVAEAYSLTRGAKRSHMSLSNASIRIRNFESHLGMQLLHRANQGVTLTPSGQVFLHHARLILQQVEFLRSDMQDYAQGLREQPEAEAEIGAPAGLGSPPSCRT